MQTGNVSSAHGINFLKNSSVVTKDRVTKPSPTFALSTVSNGSKVSISQEAMDAAKTKEYSGADLKFDFTHMSQHELQGAAKTLFSEGKISSLDMAVFQRFGRVVGNAGPHGEFVELSPSERIAADSVPKNFVKLLKEQLESNTASPEALAFYKRMDLAISNASKA